MGYDAHHLAQNTHLLPPRFDLADAQNDEERDLWYADIRYRHPELKRPYFLRLGLVRYQFGSTVGCETARIVTTDWIPVPQRQTVTVTALNADTALVSVAERLRTAP